MAYAKCENMEKRCLSDGSVTFGTRRRSLLQSEQMLRKEMPLQQCLRTCVVLVACYHLIANIMYDGQADNSRPAAARSLRCVGRVCVVCTCCASSLHDYVSAAAHQVASRSKLECKQLRVKLKSY